MVLQNLVHVKVEGCIMSKNSGYFRGTLISILNTNSHAEVFNSDFDHNNGVTGGLFYVYTQSVIDVINSTMFGNFAVSASIAYVNSDGK